MVSQVNPIVYMVNGFRFGFLGVSDVDYMVSLLLLIGFNVVLFTVAYRLLKKGVGIRS
jgi:ABC-2 type transport system permease protein